MTCKICSDATAIPVLYVSTAYGNCIYVFTAVKVVLKIVLQNFVQTTTASVGKIKNLSSSIIMYNGLSEFSREAVLSPKMQVLVLSWSCKRVVSVPSS